MVPPTEPTATPLISRREAIRRAALLYGVVVSSEWLAAAGQATGRAAPGLRLSPAHAAIAGAVADRIIPRTDTPGAADVGVPAFIDLLYGGFMTPAERQILTDGLNGVEAAGKAAYGGASFSTLAPDRQDAVLTTIARADEGKDHAFFQLIRSATILGYFTSEQVGRNVLHYDPVPGRYDGCVPIDEVGRRNWTV